MRSLASCLLAALIIGLALDFVAPAASVGSVPNRWPTIDMTQQVVNRDGKTDRLTASNKASVNKTVRDFAPTAVTPMKRAVPEGCDPAFSPLSASARLNYASRCMADNSDGLRTAV